MGNEYIWWDEERDWGGGLGSVEQVIVPGSTECLHLTFWINKSLKLIQTKTTSCVM